MLKNKIQLSKFEDVIGIIKQFMHQFMDSDPITQLEGCSEGLYKMEGFYREEEWGKGAMNKRTERIIFRTGHVVLREGNGKSFYHADASSSYGGSGRAHMTDYLIVLTRKSQTGVNVRNV